MTKYVVQVTSRKVRDSISVKTPKNIITYKQHMGGVDCGDHNMWMVPVFANVSHFLKWYKKAFLGLTDVSLLQVIVAWNLEMNIPDIPRRGRQPKFRELKRWLFYSISSKEMMIYVDNKGKNRNTHEYYHTSAK